MGLELHGVCTRNELRGVLSLIERRRTRSEQRSGQAVAVASGSRCWGGARHGPAGPGADRRRDWLQRPRPPSTSGAYLAVW
jgi:hypothetical protein